MTTNSDARFKGGEKGGDDVAPPLLPFKMTNSFEEDPTRPNIGLALVCSQGQAGVDLDSGKFRRKCAARYGDYVVSKGNIRGSRLQRKRESNSM